MSEKADIGVFRRDIPETLSESAREPGDADGLPRDFPPPHPDAVRSLGDEMVAHAERREGRPLRWWQWLTAQRRYEVRGDGSWCWLLVFTSVSRQQGKSVELAEDAAWHGSLGLGALTLHAADRVATSRDVQAALWPWAEEAGLKVARQLGDSRITWPDGSCWKTVAMGSAYSRRPGRLLVDEAWDMDPAVFWNAMFPALGGSDGSAQSLFWSAANEGDRGLVVDLRGDPAVCRMEWGALPGEDRSDPGVWRASTAHWSPSRERLMAAAAGKPGFAENWLNVWPDPASAGGPPAVRGRSWNVSARPGMALPRDRAVLALSLDVSSGLWPAVRAAALPGGAVGVELLGTFGSLGEASAAVRAAAGSACVLLVPSHGLRGQVRVPGLPAPFHLQESDALSALALAPSRLDAGAVLHPGDPALTAAALALSARRAARVWDPGVLALVAAWWAGKARPLAAGA